MSKIEKKFIDVGLEIKQDSIKQDEQFGFFEGYASTFGNMDKHEDIIESGAFLQSLNDKKPSDIKMFWNHWSDNLIGSYLELKEDNKGLYVKGRINLMVEKGREAYALLKAGDLDRMSIGFRIKEANDNPDEDIRIIKKVDLFEISLVPIPANDLAEVVDVKSLDEIKTIKDVEAFLKSKGFSNNGSKKLISIVKEAALQRDAEELKKQRDAETLKQINNELKGLTQKFTKLNNN